MRDAMRTKRDAPIPMARAAAGALAHAIARICLPERPPVPLLEAILSVLARAGTKTAPNDLAESVETALRNAGYVAGGDLLELVPHFQSHLTVRYPAAKE